MKRNIVLLLLLFTTIPIWAQNKPLIDTGMLGRWPQISPFEGSIAMSNDGRYAAYVIYNQPIGQRTLVLQDLRNYHKRTVVCSNPRILFFSADSRQLCWQQGDSVWLQATDHNESRLLGVTNEVSYPLEAKGKWVVLPDSKPGGVFKLVNLITGKEQKFTAVEDHSWVAGGFKLVLITSRKDMKLLDLVTSKEYVFAGVKDYALSSAGKNMLLVKEGRGNEMHLQWVNLDKGEPVTIWAGQAGEQPGEYVYDKAGEQLAFTVRSREGALAIWHYQAGRTAAMLETDNSTTGLAADLRISGIRAFSYNGRWLFFNVRRQLTLLPTEQVTAPVDIWSYRDETLNPAQNGEVPGFHDYVAVVEVSSKKVRLLEQWEDERIAFTSSGDHLILRKGGPNDALSRVGAWWPYCAPYSFWLLSLEDGNRRLIKQTRQVFSLGYSPESRWIYYWDVKLKQYFTVDPGTGKTVNLTGSLPVTVANDIEQTEVTGPVGIAGWYAGDSAMLVYDNYDIWKLDPSGRNTPVNITGGYGKRNGIKLRLVYENKSIYSGNEELLLTGFDVVSRYNGFFSIRLDRPGNPALLTMGPYTYYQNTVMKQSFNNTLQPLSGGRGKDKRWIVMRQSAMEYPNLYVSKGLKQFTPLTQLQPQKAYNWLRTEAVSWRMYNGQLNYGVLYKPENFDSTRKYPIIFNYYDKYSQRCYQFPMPGLTVDNINIPWFVSRGYLVFTPDIQYTVASNPHGMTISEAAYNAVASAAEYLSKRSYIDKDGMAIQGHSFGGHETNAIITQSHLFAAAAEVAGYSDHFSAYLTLVGVPVEKDHKIDHFNQRMGATPWERPDLFRRNSPTLNADKVTTPLLIVHNKKDGSVNFRQGVEMYMALRRLGKPCWLLQYDNSGHALTDEKDALDYTIRLTQYFDHYLKGTPAPQWMTMHTLGGYKWRNNLYTLAPDGNCGKDCKVCKAWNEKYREE